MNKIAKYFLITLAAGFLFLVVYANVRTIPLAEKVKSVRMVAFRVSGLASQADGARMQSRISHLPGVTACTFNAAGHVAAVTYHPDETSQQAVSDAVNYTGACNATIKNAADGPKCPVDGVFVFWDRVLDTLRFV